ncbi:HlyD family efflux transporter periplasmic adaptor subunit [Arsenicitalea aurantiaca]|uniref:HlyD family efflux transporter periplasmic adaptor subunit n=1 Tax=Arsenicitalea aurantiaca TaxID=1783274 RepID=A0A433X852_9HYPH|nr:efflux RND transporter periplasmic adaptor subunit [Arsenicitalea aurantiaca]RUT30261.1 HlyD family efflux transporter periplasmic adaptor subunit [Arsenicitalea aurantiaca]
MNGPGPAAVTPPPRPGMLPGALAGQWHDALAGAEPHLLVLACPFVGPDGRLAAAIAIPDGGPVPEALEDLARIALDRGQLKLAALPPLPDAPLRTGMAIPLVVAGQTLAIALAAVALRMPDATRFAATFEISVHRLAEALAAPRPAPRPEPRPGPSPRAASGPAEAPVAPDAPPPPLSAADCLALLAAPGEAGFTQGLYERLGTALSPDFAVLARVRRGRIKIVRSTVRQDPLPRGSRLGQARRAAILALAGSGRAIVVSGHEDAAGAPRDPALVDLDLGVLASGEGVAEAVAVALPERHGKGELVYLAERAERPGPDFEPVLRRLATDLPAFATTLLALRKKPGREAASRRNPWLDPFALRPWLALGGVALLVWLLLPAPFMIVAEATLRSRDETSVVATRDGFLTAVNVRPGETVRAGTLIAEFDTRELLLRQSRTDAQLAQARSRREGAAAGFNTAALRVTDAEIDALEAERDLVALLLEQSRIVANEDSVIVSGDMADRIGSAMRRGEMMFRLAPLTAFVASIDVPQQDILEIEAGQPGTLRLTALPFETFPVAVERVAPSADSESQTGAFNIRAGIEGAHPSFRPGMKGVVHIEAGETVRIWTLTRDLVFWLRMALWRWIP